MDFLNGLTYWSESRPNWPRTASLFHTSLVFQSKKVNLLTTGVTEEHRRLLVPVAVGTLGVLVTGRLHEEAKERVCWRRGVSVSEGGHLPVKRYL